VKFLVGVVLWVVVVGIGAIVGGVVGDAVLGDGGALVGGFLGLIALHVVWIFAVRRRL
jgi:hypothetical protein